MFDLSQRVKVTKVGDSVTGRAFDGVTPETKPYESGDVYLGYKITGALATLPQVGGSLVVWRDSRNGEEVSGIFRTSEIKGLHEGPTNLLIETLNSSYIVESLDAEGSDS